MSANGSALPPLPSLMSNCFGSSEGNVVFLVFTVSNVLLLLPFFIFILHLGHRRHRSASTSHADIITYHMVVMEMIYILASAVYCVGIYGVFPAVTTTASHLVFITSCGHMSFHSLTCVERYVAVVHPITYMRLKKGAGVQTRNATICCVWLLIFAQLGFSSGPSLHFLLLPYLLQLTVCVLVIALCSVAVLRALKRPAPGDGGGDRDRVDRSKQRAFNAMMAIMGTLLLKFGSNLICTALFTLPQVDSNVLCVMTELSFWFGVPSSLVLPLLFLHRAGKLPCCRSNTDP